MNSLKFQFCAKKFSLSLTNFRLVKCVVLLIFVISFSACKDKKAVIPSYIHISKFDFKTNLLTEGNPSSDFIDGHVYVNGKFYGIYELPVTIPVKESGKCEITIFPGIKEYQITASHKTMKVLKAFETQINLTENEIDTIFPETAYRENVEFAWIEDFESGIASTVSASKNTTSDSVLVINKTDENAFPSSLSEYTGKIFIPASDEEVLFEQISEEKFKVPNKGDDVYLEIDYKSNIYVQFGIYADKPDVYEQIPFIILPPTDEWKKVYLNLSIETSPLPDNTKIQVFYGFLKSAEDTNLSATVYLDNIKLSYLR